MLFIAIIIGTLIGIFGVYAVVFTYKYKGTSKADMARILGAASVAVVVSVGQYLLQYIFWDGTELDIYVSIAFSLSIIVSLVLFFWIKKNEIG